MGNSLLVQHAAPYLFASSDFTSVLLWVCHPTWRFACRLSTVVSIPVTCKMTEARKAATPKWVPVAPRLVPPPRKWERLAERDARKAREAHERAIGNVRLREALE